MELGLYPLHFLIMTTFDEKLKALLKTEQSFLDKDWELLEWKLQDSARNADEKLIKLLITDEEMRNKFFSEIAWYQVFNGNLFIEYISNKNFLDNSYTKYKNKIWLQINGKFLKENWDVELVRPFKDCVLEWWQSKEDEKKKEIFFNEILAQDEIDKLFAPKVLTNFKKYDKDWEHKVESFNRDENWTIKDNLIIKWNNLLALHTLKKEFEWKIKCIYIDPPYYFSATKRTDSFAYNSNFKLSTRLTFMKNRLEVARELLTDDWSLFVQISDDWVWELHVLLKEIFNKNWENNFINKITVKTKSPSWFASVNPWVFETAEYILCFAKNKKLWKYNPQFIETDYDSNYKRYIENIWEDYSKWKVTDLFEKIASDNWFSTVKDAQKKLWKTIFMQLVWEFALENNKSIFRYTAINDNASGETVKIREISKQESNKIFYINRDDNYDIYIQNWQEIAFYSKKIRNIDWKNVPSMQITNMWTDTPYEGIAKEWWVTLKWWKKPEKLIQRIINLSSIPWDIILDYHLWSWTTCAVAHKMWRQYIWIEQLDYWENDSVVRLQNVIKWDTTGISESVNWKGWWEFIYCELKKYNQEFIEQIETAKNTDELLKIRESMKEKAYFKYNFDMQTFEENMDYFKNSTSSLKEQKELLIEILNKNQLYVNLSDIDDENFEVSDEDKKLNSDFYSI